MTKFRNTTFALAPPAAAGGALSQGAFTREQVKAELAEAIRTGDIIGNSETGQKLNEMYPGRYPAKPVMAGKTRSEVRAELAEAVRTGDIIVNGETGLKANELSPGAYPMQARGRKVPTPATTAQSEVRPAR